MAAKPEYPILGHIGTAEVHYDYLYQRTQLVWMLLFFFFNYMEDIFTAAVDFKHKANKNAPP